MNANGWLIITVLIVYTIANTWLGEMQAEQATQFMQERDSARQGMIVAYLELERMQVAHEREKAILQHELYVAWTDVCMAYKQPKAKDFSMVEKQCKKDAIKSLNKLYKKPIVEKEEI